MLTSRQEMILKSIVEEFIKTAEPVGSKTLVEKYNLNYSTATIRNEMNFLEQNGLLEKTHTSSGRVPSTEGYRYYTQYLMELDTIPEEKYELSNVMFEGNAALEDVIQKSCDILSNMTSLTSVVLGPEASRQKLSHIKIFPLDDHSCVSVFITDSGHTENKVFKFTDEVTIDDLKNCTDILNDRLVGTPINEIVDKMNEIKPILAHAVKRHEVLFNAFMQAFIKFASENGVYYSGVSNMLYQPEFADVERMKELMKMLEDNKVWRSISSNSKSLKLAGGQNNELVWIDDMAVVSSKFNVGDSEGQLMVIGPSRMDYSKVVGMLEFMSSVIENQFNKRNK